MSYLRAGNVLNALAVFHGTGDDVGLVVEKWVQDVEILI